MYNYGRIIIATPVFRLARKPRDVRGRTQRQCESSAEASDDLQCLLKYLKVAERDAHNLDGVESNIMRRRRTDQKVSPTSDVADLRRGR